MAKAAEKPRVIDVAAAARQPALRARGSWSPRALRLPDTVTAVSLTTTSPKRYSPLARRALTAKERGRFERRAGSFNVGGRFSQRRNQRVSRCAWRGSAGRHQRVAIRCVGAARVPHPSIAWRRGPGSTRSIALLGSVGVHSLPIVLGGFMGSAATSGLSTSAGWATMVRLTRQCSGSPAATADRQTR